MQDSADVLIIGSGPAGVHAALPLVEAGRRVTLIDVGMEAPAILGEDPGNFEDVRRTRTDQWRWFLGEDFSAIPVRGLEGGHGGGMTSGNRSYVTRGTDTHLPTRQSRSHVVQSLAEGGLGAAWGGACAYLCDADLTALGLPASHMRSPYDRVTEVIGISGPPRPFVQPPLRPDHHAAALLAAAARQADRLRAAHIAVTQPWSAVITEDKDNRSAYRYTDMDYYSDATRSVYRPQYTLEVLRRFDHFRYVPHHLVERIEETEETCIVHARNIHAPSEPARFDGQRLILAAGAVSSARILLRSLRLYDQPIPFVTKPHAFVVCLHPRMLGTPGPKERLSLCQLLMIDDEKTADGMESGCAQLYSYRSLLLFRLLSSVPLPAPLALRALSLLTPAFVIADVRFPGHASPDRSLRLHPDGTLSIAGDPLHRRSDQKASLKRLYRSMRWLGLWPIRTLFLPDGSSSHYAGTVPVSARGEFPLGCTSDGLIHGFTKTFVADAAMFRCLSPLPHTLTIMANARRVGEGVMRTMEEEDVR